MNYGDLKKLKKFRKFNRWCDFLTFYVNTYLRQQNLIISFLIFPIVTEKNGLL